MADNNNILSITFDKLKNFLGLNETKIKNKLFSDYSKIGMYGPLEANKLLTETYVKEPIQRQLVKSDLITYLHPIFTKLAKKKLNAEKIRTLAPEINKASSLFATFIMSPNDLQDGSILFNLDLDENVLPEVYKKKIIDLLSDYFNKQLQLGIKETRWIDQILFTTGSQPILIVPNNRILEIKNRNNENTSTNDIKLSSNKVYIENIKKDGILTNTPNPWNLASENIVFKKYDISKESMNKSLNNPLDFELQLSYTNLVTNVKSILENIDPITGDNIVDNKNFNRYTFDETKFKTTYENVKVKILKELSDGDFIRVSDNPEIIRMGHEHKSKTNNKIQERFDKAMLKDGNVIYDMEEIVSLTFEDSKFPLLGHPLFLELPSESVVPISIPSDKSKHIGYFIILDEYGYPIRITDELLNSKCCEPGSVNMAYEAMFGNCNQGFGNSNLKGNLGHVITSKIFEDILNQYLNKKIESLDYGAIEVDKMNSIAACMFYRLMFHKRTMLLFVPEHLLTYIAYDYDDNGVGKSLISNIEFVLALKNTFMVASILSMMNSAVPHTKFNINFSTEIGEVNPQRIMDQVRSMYIENNQIQFSCNPADITKNIYNNAALINPTNLPGAESFSVERITENNDRGMEINSDFFEKLDNLVSNGLPIPPSVLNKLNEEEFARSVITNNLFLIKEGLHYQRETIPFNNKIVRTYLKYSAPLRAELKKIIDDMGTSKEYSTGENFNSEQLVNKIIRSVATSLSPPNIGVDKTQFAEIKEYIERLNEITELLFNPELFIQSSEAAQNAMTIVRAYVKRKLTKDFLNVIGADKVFEIPEIEDINSEDLAVEFRKAVNLMKHLSREKDVIEPENSEDDFGSDESTDEFGSSDGNDDFGGEDDMSMDMSDDTSLDEAPPIEEETASDDENSKEDTSENSTEPSPF